MLVWHLTPDAPRSPTRVSPDDWVELDIGTWPIEPDQVVWVEAEATHADGSTSRQRVDARWQHNRGENSYWRAELAPFARGDAVSYLVRARSPSGGAAGPSASFRVGPKLHLAILWHHHQPLYRDVSLPSPRGSYLESAVRRHAIRDYYSMAALVAEHPGIRLTINLTPSLLSQIEDYVDGGATDRALELTRLPAEELAPDERAELLRTFFDAHEENQIRPHARYAELLDRAKAGEPFGVRDFRDLQMWFNLAWFAKEFRDGEVSLVTGAVASVRRFVERGRDFTASDIEAMVAEQYEILRAIIPLHRLMQERGQIEVTTSPYYHPILPLLIDTDAATIDRPGATLPPRFAHPEDAEAHVRLAVEDYRRWFGRSPRGMWPAEGAVSQSVVPMFARHGVRWIASDRGVLARSASSGYEVDEPDTFCRPYRAETDGNGIDIFFRDAWLSDHIGFHYQRHPDYAEAAGEFLQQVKQRYAWKLGDTGDRILTVILDGENAWSAYREDARPFLHALYALLEHDPEVETVTFSEWLEGNVHRGIEAHPSALHPRVDDLFTASWADETGSAPGVDLGTWIGEPEENDAWALLAEVREFLASSGATPESAPAAYHAMYAAEGSDWFWWLGVDQESGRDPELDMLFHAHLRAVYLALGEHPPDHVTPHAGPPTITWTPTCVATTLAPGARLLVRTLEPGAVAWRINHAPPSQADLIPMREAAVGVRHHQRLLGPFPPGTREIHLRVMTQGARADADAPCPPNAEHVIRIHAYVGSSGVVGAARSSSISPDGISGDAGSTRSSSSSPELTVSSASAQPR